jgi:potassium-transporting ATPase KdpC subunit
MKQQLIIAFRVTLVMTILTGLVYPGVVTVLAQALFHDKANGSLVSVNGNVVGSDLIGQKFAKPEYFQPRPSAAGDGYDASSSGGSNLGPTSKKLSDRINDAATSFRKDNPDYNGPIPADMLTASGSGLDPHISPASAEAQAARVAKARGASINDVHSLIVSTTEPPDLGLLGEPRVNVLRLNIALDAKFRTKVAP